MAVALQGQTGGGAIVQFYENESFSAALRAQLDPNQLFARLRPYVDQAMSVIEGEIQARTPQGAGDELKRSVVHNVFLQSGDLYGSVFIQPESPAAEYAIFVELGRGPGKMPPIESILPWALKHVMAGAASLHEIAKARGDVKAARKFNKLVHKTKERESAVNSAAWAIAVHIAKHGTHAQHFFERGWTAGYPQADQIIQYGIEQSIVQMQNA